LDLSALGWNDCFGKVAAPHFVARVAAQHKNSYRVFCQRGQLSARVTGRFSYLAATPSSFPVVGDWVVCEQVGGGEATILQVLPRRTVFSRQAAGEETQEQVVAANIDTVFIVTALNQDYNLRRIERYLTVVWESGCHAVVILSKADLCDCIELRCQEVQAIAPGVAVHALSVHTGLGLPDIRSYLQPGVTVALLGSSGVGKSTLINCLLGQEAIRVNSLRADGKGRHTTTSRQLYLLPQGGIVLDTPGMRELQLWGGEEGLLETYRDITSHAERCRFRDCRHESEPGCAVKAAIVSNELDPKRLESYRKLAREIEYAADRRDYLQQKERIARGWALQARHIKKK
jgi:ribosome biogenesis GTPase